MFSLFRKSAAAALAALTAHLAAHSVALAQGPQPPAPPSLGPAGAAFTTPASDPLPALVAEALRNNFALKAARLEPEAARQEGRGAAAFKPPQVGVEFWHAPLSSFPNPVKDQQEIAWFVEQSFPLPGKRAALARPAERRAEAGEARSRAMEIALAREVKEAYLALYRIDALRRINADNQSLVRRLVEVARKQYELGIGGQGDILKAHAELASLSLDAVKLSESREESLGNLNALLARSPDSAFTPPEALRPVSAQFPFDKVMALAREKHPALKALDAEAKAMEAEAAAAGRELWPDLMVRGSYKDMREPPLHGGEPEDGWSVMVGMDLPFAFWSAPKYRSGYRSAGTRAEMARLDRKSGEARLAADIRAALARMRAAAEMLDLSRAAMLPHAEQALQSEQAAYNTGKSSFADLMDAYRMSIEAREEEQDAVIQVVRSRADLEAAVGMEFNDIAQAVSIQGGRP